MNVIKANKLTAGYQGIPILKDLDFEIPEGRITVILGKSGCGKSTLLKSLAGLLPPLSGELFFAGEKIDFLSEKSLARLYSRIGVLYQNGALLNSFNLFDNVALPLRMRYPGMQPSVVREMVLARLDLVGLGGSGNKYPSELSGGMRKRGSLARAMILDPDVIFCDEPSSGLDPITLSDLDAFMVSLRDDFAMTLVVVTHELRSIRRIADRVLVLHQDRIHFTGSLAELEQNNDRFIRKFFLREG